MNDLPKEFDLCVIGTGFQESVIAAAASRVGKSVLHIDQNEFYGGFWASYNLENFMNHLEVNKSDDTDKVCKIRNVNQQWYEFTDEIPEINGWNKEKIIKDSRRFNIDLIPKLNYCNGKLVELLISSNICRYTEFRAVDKVLTARNGQLDVVPGSRADIFTKKNVSIIEKRLLMKFITQCVEYKGEAEKKEETFDFPEDGKFIDLMKQQKLTDNLIHYILYSMCMGNDETTFKEGLDKIRMYLTSIGRYGNTPYLFPMFGCGEIPQCFCRLCAVFGGIYWLGQAVSDVNIVDAENDEKVVTMKFGDELIISKKLVFGLDSNLMDISVNPISYISRAVFITTKPVGGSSVNSELDGGGAVLLYHPIEGSSDGVTMIQLSHYTSCISKGLYLVHLSTPFKKEAQEDLKDFIDTFFREDYSSEDDTKPTVIYSAYFEIPSSIKGHNYVDSQNGPIFYCCGPFAELDYDESIRQSRLLYAKMYPEDEFLPKAPEPEEIIIGDEDDTNASVNLGVLADLVIENDKSGDNEGPVTVSDDTKAEKEQTAAENQDPESN
ncbi:rab proteins geranylgeranyltransferase component A [Chironomus tepperi]|uniref:rab proteins geranylgeranyltransferase component A n=1 Tax=Chironomus tepperi TaxID=113505 RepID=UPI00391EFBBF